MAAMKQAALSTRFTLPSRCKRGRRYFGTVGNMSKAMKLVANKASAITNAPSQTA